MGLNTAPNPRGSKIKALTKARATKEAVRKRTEFVDRGAGTLMDNYSLTHIADIVRVCWSPWSKGSYGTSQTVQAYLRTMVDFLFGHFMLLRGESRRMVKLADLFSLELRNEGPTICTALVMIMNNGKTNQQNRLEYGIVVRHKDVFFCVLSQLAFYFFFIWNIAGEPHPRFQHRQQWYDVKLFHGENSKNTQGLSYATQLNWTHKIFDHANLKSLKKTHAGRTNGARHAELNGVSEAQIRRAERWNNDSLTTSYLSHLPREFVRSMAGFETFNQGNYYLPRAKISPPQSLLDVLWPWVDEWQLWFRCEGNAADPALTTCQHLDLESMSENEDRTDMAAQGFLRLLTELRVILLQDSVILRRHFPQHPIFTDPLFVREDYQAFALEVEKSLQDLEEPDEIRLRNIVPDIANQMNMNRQDIVRSLDGYGHKIVEMLQTIDRRQEDFFSGTFRMIPSDKRQDSHTMSIPADSSVSLLADPVADSSADPSAGSSAGPSTGPSAGPSAGLSVDLSAALKEKLSQSVSNTSDLRTMDPDASPPAYKMSRTISTVTDLWREWTVGLGSNPAVQALEDTYGASWRPDAGERVWFGRRKVIIDEIRRRQIQTVHRDPQIAVQEVEIIRRQLGGNKSLHKLWQHLSSLRT